MIIQARSKTRKRRKHRKQRKRSESRKPKLLKDGNHCLSQKLLKLGNQNY